MVCWRLYPYLEINWSITHSSHKKHSYGNSPYLSRRPTVHLNTPPKATSSPNITTKRSKVLSIKLSVVQLGIHNSHYCPLIIRIYQQIRLKTKQYPLHLLRPEINSFSWLLLWKACYYFVVYLAGSIYVYDVKEGLWNLSVIWMDTSYPRTQDFESLKKYGKIKDENYDYGLELKSNFKLWIRIKYYSLVFRLY